MFHIPNALLVPEEDKSVLQALFQIVEGCDEFISLSKHIWKMDKAEFRTSEEIRTEYVAAGKRRGQEWAELLNSHIYDGRYAVFGVASEDRAGLESYPPHVRGFHYTFFVDCLKKTLVYSIRTIYCV